MPLGEKLGYAVLGDDFATIARGPLRGFRRGGKAAPLGHARPNALAEQLLKLRKPVGLAVRSAPLAGVLRRPDPVLNLWTAGLLGDDAHELLDRALAPAGSAKHTANGERGFV